MLSASSQPDRQPDDPFEQAFGASETSSIHFLKTSDVADAFERVRACHLAGKIPDEALPYLKRCCDLVKARFADDLKTFLTAVSSLALDESRSATSKWEGVKAMAALHGKGIDADGVVRSLLTVCRNDTEGRLAVRMFDLFSLVRDINSHRIYVQTIATVKRENLLAGSDPAMVSEVMLALAARMLKQEWKQKHIQACVRALHSDHSSTVGIEARLAVLDRFPAEQRKPRSFIRQLELITSAESHFAQSPELLQHAPMLLSDAFRDPGVLVLDKLKSAHARDLLFRTMTAVSHSPAARPYYLAALSVGRKPHLVLANLERLDTLFDSGLAIEYCVLLAGKLNEKHLKISGMFDEAFGIGKSPIDLYKGIEAFLERSESRASVRSVTFIEILGRLTEKYAQSLTRAETLTKLCLCLHGTGLSVENRIKTMSELSETITELASQTDISDLLRAQGASFREDSRAFSRLYKPDNPPFSLDTTPYEAQQRIHDLINAIFDRAEDPHYGFWSSTYLFRHTPISRRCIFDEFAVGVNADLYVIPSADPRRFPGRGRIIERIDIDSIFNSAIAPEVWRDTVFPAYGKIEGNDHPGNLHAIDNLMRSRITELRACDGVAVPSNRFFDILGEPMTLLAWNHHFDASGAHQLSLVPSRAFNSFFDRLRIPYNPFSDTFPNAAEGDIADQPPTLKAIEQRAKEMGLGIGVINITSGSVFLGGFCNGLISDWQHNFRGEQKYYDAFNRLHKWHIGGNQGELKKLHALHERIFEVARGLLDVRDMFKFAIGRDARGDVERNNAYRHPRERNFDYSEVKHGGRMLHYFCEFREECRQAGVSQDAPVLVLAPMELGAPQPNSPLVLDGMLGFAFHQWGRPIEIEIEDGVPDANLIAWWNEYVDPLLSQSENHWIAPRLVARENYVELINYLRS